MKLQIINFIILISLLLSCENSDRSKDNPKEDKKTAFSDKVKAEIKAKKGAIQQISKVDQSLKEIPNKVDECLFKRDVSLPKIREVIGDTININNTNDWLLRLDVTVKDEKIKSIINRGRKFFQINETEKFITIGFLEEEGEYLGIHAYSISKENCEILGKKLIAQATAWENGYKEMYSIFHDDFTIKRQNQTGAKDWGDYTTWKRDTVISILTFSEKGQINLKKK